MLILKLLDIFSLTVHPVEPFGIHSSALKFQSRWKNDVIFGLLMEDVCTQFILNIILILGKYYIHKCKCLKTKPFVCVFFN